MHKIINRRHVDLEKNKDQLFHGTSKETGFQTYCTSFYTVAKAEG